MMKKEKLVTVFICISLISGDPCSFLHQLAILRIINFYYLFFIELLKDFIPKVELRQCPSVCSGRLSYFENVDHYMLWYCLIFPNNEALLCNYYYCLNHTTEE